MPTCRETDIRQPVKRFIPTLTIEPKMKIYKRLTAVAIAALLPCTAFAADAPAAADTIFYGGPIVTVNPKQPEVSALAVRGGNILAVGDASDILKQYKGDNTRLIDLKGHALMPGFVEPHVHIALTSQMEHIALDVSNFKLPYDTLDAILDKLRAAKSKLPEGAWIIAFGVDPSRTTPLMAELNADLLDKVSMTNPIFVLNQSGHLAYVNHKAIEVAGVTAATPSPGGGGVYVKDAKGNLTGKLIEPTSYNAFLGKMTAPSKEILAAAYLKTANSMSATGITTAAEITIGSTLGLEPEYAMMNELIRQESFPMRVRGYLYGPAVPAGFSKIKPNDGDDKFRVIGVKFLADGSTQGLTAAVSKPYAYPKGTKNLGALDYDDAGILAASKPFFDQGWQIAIHANGDRAVGQALNLYAKLLAGEKDPAARRLRIEHFTVTTDAEVDQARKLGVVPGMTIGHVGFWGEVFHNHILGPERAERIDPTGSLVKRNMHFTFHSDSPVSPYGPLRYISTGASRLWQLPPRKVLGPDQRIAVDQAIKAVTLDAAYSMFMDDRVGSLEVGKWADLVMLERDPRHTDLDKIPDIKVLGTWLNGKPAYVAPGAQ